MELLPTHDERKWLGRYLRKLIERQGADTFLRTPLLEPTSRYFPDAWSGRVADVHRLTQRLMHQAGLGELRLNLQGFEDGRSAWDAGTAGWFAGISDNVCEMGVHVRQLANPEQAVGVMAHEVAHAWRTHQNLKADRRDREELLTDLTTIYLGFGIFTTNNTDRYRATGNWSETRWSTSSVGYLPPQAMSWLLALQASARNRKDELRAIEKHLEPNQLACFRAAIDEIARDPSSLDELALPKDVSLAADPYALIHVEEPTAEDAAEPPPGAGSDPHRNKALSIFRVPKPRSVAHAYFGALGGFLLGAAIAFLFFSEGTQPFGLSIAVTALVGTIAATLLTPRGYFCSERDCATTVERDAAVCPGCGGTFVRTLKNQREFGEVRLDQLERDSASIEYEECDACRPEEPCAKHR